MGSNFLDLNNARFVDEIYLQWKADAATVDLSSQSFFAQWEAGKPAEVSSIGSAPPPTMPPAGATTADPAYAQGRLTALLSAYRDVGYIHADFNPLRDYSTPELQYMICTMEGTYESLDLKSFGFWWRRSCLPKTSRSNSWAGSTPESASTTR